MDKEDKIQIYLKGYKKGQKEAWSKIKNLVSKYDGWELRSRIESKIGTLNQEVEAKRRDVLENPDLLRIGNSTSCPSDTDERKTDDIRLKWNKGDSYLFVEKNLGKSMEETVEVMRKGAKTIFIVRQSPDKLVNSFSIPAEESKFIWLSRTNQGMDSQNEELDIERNSPSDLSGLSNKIGRFLKNNPESVVFLSGLSLMTNYNEENKVFKLVNFSKDKITENDSCLVTSLSGDALDEKFTEKIKSEFDQII